MSNVKVVMESHARGNVYIDGEELEGVVSIQISAGVDQTNKVTFSMIADIVEFEGIADVTTIKSEVKDCQLGGKYKKIAA